MTVERPSPEWLNIRHLYHLTGSGEGSMSHSRSIVESMGDSDSESGMEICAT